MTTERPAMTASGTGPFRQFVWLALAVVGAVLPLSQFLPWLAEHGPDVSRFVDDLFSNRIGSFFALDVLVSATVLLMFLVLDGVKLRTRQRLLVAAGTCLIGVSFGLPLLLFLRERVQFQTGNSFRDA